MIRAVALALLLLFLPGFGISQTAPQNFSVLTINAGLDADATGFALLPDNRIFVVHQFSGQVQLIVNGVLNPQELLTVPNLQTSSEKGLLGVAVDPDFPDSAFVYLFHTHATSTNRVSRFIVGGDLQDPNSDSLTIDPASEQTLISDMPATNFNHNGGTLRFGSDKTLFISHGDDAVTSLVQNLTNLNGKILRINRDGTIPSNNPVFPNEPPGKRPEIFSFGFRNPFRFNVDPDTDELFIGDVGQVSVEEFDVSTGGENMGWPRYEGSADFQTGANLIQPDPTFPIWEYTRLPGSNSAIALATYRQQNYPTDASFPPEYEGTYFYADFYNDWIRNIRPNGSGGWMSVDFGSGFSFPVDAALGPDGSLYVLEYGNALLQIVYNPVVPVELFSFTVQALTDKVLLSWITASETNNYGFEVQRSFNNENFEAIGFVKGRGTTSARNTYHFEDGDINGGAIYYRLKQVDLNGSFEFSRVEVVEIGMPKQFAVEQNYPNPFNPATSIRFRLPENNHVTLRIFNSQGQEVKTLIDEPYQAGVHRASWDATDQRGAQVATGIYFYQIKAGEFTQVKKMLLMR